MSFDLPKFARTHLGEMNRDVRFKHWRQRHTRVDAAKCAYVKTLGKVRERCGEELWAELKLHRRILDEAIELCRQEDERERRKNAVAGDTRKVS